MARNCKDIHIESRRYIRDSLTDFAEAYYADCLTRKFRQRGFPVAEILAIHPLVIMNRRWVNTNGISEFKDKRKCQLSDGGRRIGRDIRNGNTYAFCVFAVNDIIARRKKGYEFKLRKTRKHFLIERGFIRYYNIRVHNTLED